MAEAVRAVCFDMDGVLVDSEAYWVPIEEESILPQVVPDEPVSVEALTGMNYREIYEYLTDHYDVAISREAFIDRYDAAAQEIFGERVGLLPGVERVLRSLQDRGLRVALVTSSPPHWIDIVFDRFDLHGEFDAVVSADELDGPGKPAPVVYEHAADRLGITPASTIAIEDSANGIAAAAAAGMTVIAFRFGGTLGETDRADHVVDSPASLRALLDSVTG